MDSPTLSSFSSDGENEDSNKENIPPSQQLRIPRHQSHGTRSMAPSPSPHLLQFSTMATLPSRPRERDRETEYLVRAREGERQFGDDRSGRSMAPSPSPNLMQGEVMFEFPERVRVRESTVADAAPIAESPSESPRIAAANFLEQLGMGSQLDQEIAKGMGELEWLGPKEITSVEHQEIGSEKEIVFNFVWQDKCAVEKEPKYDSQSGTSENRRRSKPVSFSPEAEYLPHTPDFPPEISENSLSPDLLPNRWDFTPTYDSKAISSTQPPNPTLNNSQSRPQDMKAKREQLARAEGQAHKYGAKMSVADLAKKRGGMGNGKRRVQKQLVKENGDEVSDVEEDKKIMDRVQLEASGRKVIPLEVMSAKKLRRGPSRSVTYPDGDVEFRIDDAEVSNTSRPNSFHTVRDPLPQTTSSTQARRTSSYASNCIHALNISGFSKESVPRQSANPFSPLPAASISGGPPPFPLFAAASLRRRASPTSTLELQNHSPVENSFPNLVAGSRTDKEVAAGSNEPKVEVNSKAGI